MRALGLLLAALLALPALAAGQPAETPAERALAWLATQSIPASKAPYLAEAAAAAGHDPARWPTPDASAFAALAPYELGNGAYYSHLRLAHAAGTSGYDPRAVHGTDYVALVRAGFSSGQSGSETYVNDDIWAILALRAAGVPPDDEQIRASVRILRATQLPDGGWSHAIPAVKGTTDVTAMALAALRAAGEDLDGFASARAFLDASYDVGTGGHVDNQGIPANCQSTVWALHGYAVLGVAPRARSLEFLAGLQNPDGGLRTGSRGASDAQCTAEAVVWLAGARYPLPSFLPLALPARSAHALENVTLSVPAPFTSARWRFDDAELAGRAVTRAFPSAGERAYHVLAEGPGVRARAQGEIAVQSARPVVAPLPTSLDALRHVPVTLDLSASRDPDGHVSAHEIDWGDGNVTTEPAHAYERPGAWNVTVRARDDAGVWSAPATTVAHVRNRAPLFGPLPARILADRAHDVAFQPPASDPDGDAVALRWRIGSAAGEGAPRFRPEALGNATLALEALDAWDGAATQNVTIEVVDLAPAIEIVAPASARPGEIVRLVANASDADDGPPAVMWRIGAEVREGAAIELALPAGRHEIEAVATDPWGLSAAATRTIVVEEAAHARIAPEIRSLQVSFEEGALVVRADVHPPGATSVARWTSDAGDGEAPLFQGALRVPLDAREARVILVATHDGLDATREAGATRAEPSRPLPLPRVRGPAGPVAVAEPVAFRVEPVEGAIEYRFDFGDGNATSWSARPEATHAWPEPGPREVRASARAPDGRVASSSLVVLVVPAPAAIAPIAEESLEPAALIALQEEAPRETPAPGWAPLALAAAALLLRRGRRAR